MDDDLRWMDLALKEALAARQIQEVPVGAVIVQEGRLIAASHNSPISRCDPSAHAEVLALRQAALAVGNYRLPDATLYVTLEPCLMCAGAIIQARLARVVFGAADPKGGAVISCYRLFDDERLNHRVAYTAGVRGRECAEILSGFFREKRVS